MSRILIIYWIVLLLLSNSVLSQTTKEISLEPAELSTVSFPIPLDSINIKFRGFKGSLYTLPPTTLYPGLAGCQLITFFSFTNEDKNYIAQVELDANRFIWTAEFGKKSDINIVISGCSRASDTLTVPAVIDRGYNSLELTIGRGFKGEVYLNDSTYLATLSILTFVRFVNQINISIKDGEEEVFWDQFSYGESFTFKNRVYTFDTLNIFSENLSIMETPYREKVLGVRENQYIAEFEEILASELNDRDLSKSGEAGIEADYLFHFWGRWCRPCMKKMPGLQALFSELNDSIELVNVAFEPKEVNFSRTREIIEQEKMTGIHILESSDSTRFRRLL